MIVTIKTAQKVNTSRRVLKAKITKSGCLEYTFDETIRFEQDGEEVEISREVSHTGRNLVHDDLLHGFSLLRTHLAFLCDQPESRDKDFYGLDEDKEALGNYTVSSYSIGGSGEHEGVTITGTRKARGKIINLNAPFQKFDDENDQYEYTYELKGLVSHLNEEVLAYVDGKIKPNAQGDLFDQQEDEKEDLEQ